MGHKSLAGFTGLAEWVGPFMGEAPYPSAERLARRSDAVGPAVDLLRLLPPRTAGQPTSATPGHFPASGSLGTAESRVRA